MKTKLIILLLAIFFINTYSQNADSLIKVSNKLYMITGLGGNVTFLETNEGVIVVDAGSVKNDGRIVEKYIKTVTNKPIKYLIFTHYHFDHTNGACGLSDNPIMIGHKNCKKNQQKSAQWVLNNYQKKNIEIKIDFLKKEIDSLKRTKNNEYVELEKEYKNQLKELEYVNETTIEFPNITFNNSMNIFLGNDTVKLIYPNNTHTDCSILVEFPNQNALITGDILFNDFMPYIDFNANCDTKNWIDKLKLYANKNYKFVIPGHGNLGNTNDLIEQVNYLTDLRKEVKTLLDKNKTFDEIKEQVKMTKYSNYGFKGMLKVGIQAVYKELTER